MKLILQITMFCLLFFATLGANCQQNRYSIDNGKLQKSGKIGLKFRIEKLKEKGIENKKARKNYRIEVAEEKNRKRYRRKIQTKKVCKRMKKNERIAKRWNKNKHPQPYYIRLYYSIF